MLKRIICNRIINAATLFVVIENSDVLVEFYNIVHGMTIQKHSSKHNSPIGSSKYNFDYENFLFRIYVDVTRVKNVSKIMYVYEIMLPVCIFQLMSDNSNVTSVVAYLPSNIYLIHI